MKSTNFLMKITTIFGHFRLIDSKYCPIDIWSSQQNIATFWFEKCPIFQLKIYVGKFVSRDQKKKPERTYGGTFIKCQIIATFCMPTKKKPKHHGRYTLIWDRKWQLSIGRFDAIIYVKCISKCINVTVSLNNRINDVCLFIFDLDSVIKGANKFEFLIFVCFLSLPFINWWN